MHIGLDLGASKTLGVAVKNQQILATLKRPTPDGSLIVFLEDFIKNLCQTTQQELQGIGIGVAGVLNKEKNKILHAPNIKILQEIFLKEELEKRFKAPVLLENDGSAFCWGEYVLGQEKKHQNIVCLTLGTGLGGGIILEGKLFSGSFSSGAEIGHMIIEEGGIKCGCGNQGCFESYCSARFFSQKYGWKDPKKVAIAARRGDKRAEEAYQEFGFWLGVGMANLVNILDPELFILGGGIMNDFDLFLAEAQKTMKERVLSPLSRQKVRVEKSKLGEKAAAVGAALLLEEKRK